MFAKWNPWGQREEETDAAPNAQEVGGNEEQTTQQQQQQEEHYFDAIAEDQHVVLDTNDMDPETGPDEKKNSNSAAGGVVVPSQGGRTQPQTSQLDPTLLLEQLEQRVAAEKFKYDRRLAIMSIVAIIFVFIWVLGLPLAIGLTEQWTYQSAWYYSIQAGFGVGFGALTVQTSGMEILLAIHCFLGALSVAFLVAALVSRAIDKADERKKNAADIMTTEEQLGLESSGIRAWLVGALLLLLVLTAGVLYGLLFEKWSFTESLYFIVSACQTSGLLAPTIKPKDPDSLFAPLFVSLLVILGVPLWAYAIGKLAVVIQQLNRTQKRQVTVMERHRAAEQAYLHIRSCCDPDAAAADSADAAASPEQVQNMPVDLLGFFQLWMLFYNLIDESLIVGVAKDFEDLKKDEEDGESTNTVPLWKINARVRFFQLVQMGLIEYDAWPEFCEKLRVVDKSILECSQFRLSNSAVAELSERSSTGPKQHT